MRNKKCWWSIWKYDESHHRIGKRVIIEYKSHTCGLPNRIKTWQDDKVIVQQPTTNQNDSTIDSRCCSYAMHNLEITTSFRSSRWGSRIDNTRVWWVFKLHKVKKYILCYTSATPSRPWFTTKCRRPCCVYVTMMFAVMKKLFAYDDVLCCWQNWSSKKRIWKQKTSLEKSWKHFKTFHKLFTYFHTSGCP